MKFEIKHKITGAIIFSLETDSLKLCVEAAVKQKLSLVGVSLIGATLDGAKLDGAWLDGAWLDGASLDGASLNRASLVGASLNRASLNRASLIGATLDGAKLDGAWLVGAKGVDKNRVTPLRILLEQPGPIWGYKLVNAQGFGPFNGGINYLDQKTDEFWAADLNRDENERCGAGINLATLDWVMKEWKPGYRILIMEFFANQPKGNLVVPTATDGKFRVGQCRRVGEKDLIELGLVKEKAK